MQTRRQALKKTAVVAGLLASTGLFPQFAFAAFNTAAFEAKNIQDALKALGAGAPVESKDITVTGSGKIGIKASSDVVIKGSKIAEN